MEDGGYMSYGLINGTSFRVRVIYISRYPFLQIPTVKKGTVSCIKYFDENSFFTLI